MHQSAALARPPCLNAWHAIDFGEPCCTRVRAILQAYVAHDRRGPFEWNCFDCRAQVSARSNAELHLSRWLTDTPIDRGVPMLARKAVAARGSGEATQSFAGSKLGAS